MTRRSDPNPAYWEQYGPFQRVTHEPPSRVPTDHALIAVTTRPGDSGLTNRRGKPLMSQAIGMLLHNQLYAGIVDVPQYGVRAKRGDFEPLISEELRHKRARLRGSPLRRRILRDGSPSRSSRFSA